MESATRREEELRRRLNSLIALARDNEEKQRRFNDVELKLIASDSLRTLMERLFHDLPGCFNLDHVTLTLLDPLGDLSQLFNEAGVTPEKTVNLQFVTESAALAPLDETAPPWLGCFTLRDHATRFPDLEARPASVALLPLVRGGELIGSLNLGSVDPQRYTTGSSTDFIARLAAITAISIENCANHERLRKVGFTDAITGINNRRYFEERLAEEFALAARTGAPLACLFIDADHFKRFNDSYGHQAGDYALHEVARVIRSQLRRSDTVSRYGGEEFVVLMPGVSRTQAHDCAERIRKAVAAHRFVCDGHNEVSLSVSIGVALTSPATTANASSDAAALLRAADQALYEAKSRGRNCVAVNAVRERSGPSQ